MKCTQCHRPVRPVVAIDIDGTIGDYYQHFRHFAGQYLGLKGILGPAKEPHKWHRTYDYSCELNEWLGLEKHVYREVKLAYRQGGGKRMMPLFSGALDLVTTLRAAGAEIWITTSRPWNRFDSTDPDTRHWLQERHQIPFDGLIYGDDKYEQLVSIVGRDRISVVLDDLPEQCKAADDLGLPYVQRWNGHAEMATMEFFAASLADATLAMLERVQQWEKVAL